MRALVPPRSTPDRDHDLARLGHVTPARVSQIMSLLLLAPAIQEELLFLPRVLKGRDPITERPVLLMATELDWQRHREMWRELDPC